MTKLRLLIALLLVFCAGARAAPATILVLGDSLSSGYGIGLEQSWPALLDKRLATQHLPYRVANVSISGETTAGGLSRLPGALRQFRPVVLILALGANDGLRGLPVEAMRDNLDAMIVAARRQGVAVLLVGMRLPPNYGPAYAARFADTYRDLAAKRKLPLVPFLLDGFAGRRDAFQADGLHPTAAYQPAILDNVWPALRRLLR